MQLLIFGICATILLTIFVNAYKRVRRIDRVKVVPQRNEQNIQLTTGINPSRQTPKWKRETVDYKAINEMYNLADLYFAKGNLKEAEKAFIQVIAMKVDHANANNKLGIIYIQQNQLKKAEAVYRALIEMYPDKAVYYSNLGRVLFTQGRYSEAVVMYERAIAIDPERPERHISLGEVYRKMKNIKGAISSFSKVLEINPRSQDMYFMIVDLLDEISAYEEGIAYLQAMLEYFPYNKQAQEQILEFRRKLNLSPLSTERERQKQNHRQILNNSTNNETLFADIKAGEAVSQAPASNEQ